MTYEEWREKCPLKRAMYEKRFPVVKLAAMLDVTTQTIHYWKGGVSGPESTKMERIAQLLGIDKEKFSTEWKEWRKNKPTTMEGT